MRSILTLLFLLFALAASHAAEFTVPVPIQFVDLSKNPIAAATVQRVTSLLTESKNVKEWLRPGAEAEKRLVLLLTTTATKSGFLTDSASVSAQWVIRAPGAQDRPISSKQFEFRSGSGGTRLNSDYVMEATRDVVLTLIQKP